MAILLRQFIGLVFLALGSSCADGEEAWQELYQRPYEQLNEAEQAAVRQETP